MKSYLGEFEELVLLTVATLGDEAYGVSIKESIEQRCGRDISIGALHSTITRLEEKKYLKSWLGGATNEPACRQAGVEDAASGTSKSRMKDDKL